MKKLLLATGMLLTSRCRVSSGHSPACRRVARQLLVVLDEQSVGLSHQGRGEQNGGPSTLRADWRETSPPDRAHPRAILGHLGMFIVDATRSEAERLAACPESRTFQEDTAGEPSALPSCFSPNRFRRPTAMIRSPRSRSSADPQ